MRATEGMRWFCGYLLKNNLAPGGRGARMARRRAMPTRGHTERLIVVGDAVDDVQLRNLAFQAQMDTVEEGAADLDIGVAILRGAARTARPGGAGAGAYSLRSAHSRRAASARQCRAVRLRRAIRRAYAELAARRPAAVQAVVRAAIDDCRGRCSAQRRWSRFTA